MKKSVSEILSNYGIQIKDEKKNDYITLCPFHNDTTPSFSIDKHKGIYQCWSCHEKGNLVTLVKKIENISYDDAKRKVNGDEKLSSFFSFENKFIKKDKKKTNALDLKYYEFKYLLELLFYRDDRNIRLRQKLSAMKNEEVFKPVLSIQKKLKDKIAGYNFNMKRFILGFIFECIETIDSYNYSNKSYEDKKYEMLFDYLKFYNFQKEVEIINEIINNKIYKAIIQEEKWRSEIRKESYKIYKKCYE